MGNQLVFGICSFFTSAAKQMGSGVVSTSFMTEGGFLLIFINNVNFLMTRYSS